MKRAEKTEKVRAIIAEVAGKHGLTLDEMRESCGLRKLRNRALMARLSLPRQEVMYRAVKEVRAPLRLIASELNLSSHKTVMHGVIQHAERNYPH